MAATGKTPILLYGSTTATNQPSAGNLTNSSDGCEIAINVADKNLFFKDATNTVNTVPVRQSSASSDGWLSSTDWSTFNSKQPAGTYVTSVTGTAPVVSSGGTTPAISMAAANGSTNGYLTSTDWTTFNGKQAALVSGTNIKTVSGTTLLGSGDLGTIGTGYGGTGLTSFTANGIVYATSSSALTTSANLQYNNSTGVFSSYITGTNSRLANFATTTFTTRGLRINSYTSVNGASDCGIEFDSGIGGYGGFKFSNSGTPLATIDDANSNLTVNLGNLVIGTSGKGIDFSATPGTGTSELLADYEEGTWTPEYTATGATFSYSNQYGTYVKIGSFVYAQFYLNATASGTTTGDCYISNLPFTAANLSAYNQSGSCAWFTGPKSCTALVQNNTTTALIWQNTTVTTLKASDVSGYYYVGTLIYRSA